MDFESKTHFVEDEEGVDQPRHKAEAREEQVEEEGAAAAALEKDRQRREEHGCEHRQALEEL